VILPFTEQDDFADRQAATIAAIDGLTYSVGYGYGGYGGYGGYYTGESENYYSSSEILPPQPTQPNGFSVGGGGDSAETPFDGLRVALDGSMGEWRAGAGTRQIVLITDAPVKDAALISQVNALAQNIGATIGSSFSLALAGGSIDTFNLCDDLLAPETLAATAGILDRFPQVGMVYTDHLLIDDLGRTLGMGAKCQIPYSKERLLIDFMTFHFRLIRWEMYDRIGGIDLAVPYVQDYDLCLKISEIAEIYHHPQPLYYYRVHPTMISQTQQVDVTTYAAMAVRNALVRRGLSDRYRLDVNSANQFRIVKI
jgi:hypothetical protein